MNEKGFATIFGLCLILVIAFIVKGIQEAEMNHAYETTDFQAEFDLQSAADSGIYAAAEKVHGDPSGELPINRTHPALPGGKRNKHQLLLLSETVTSPSGSIKVDVWGERLLMKQFRQNYPSGQDTLGNKKVYILLSKAELQSGRMDGKIYRRAFAYVLLNEDGTSDKTIHFMELPSKND